MASKGWRRVALVPIFTVCSVAIARFSPPLTIKPGLTPPPITRSLGDS